MIIAIDGPAASGKGTLGKRLAHHYGYRHLDTGVIYRAVAYAMMQAGAELSNEVLAVAAALELDPEKFGNPILKTQKVGDAASVVSAIPQVREVLVNFQRQFAADPPGRVTRAISQRPARQSGNSITPNTDTAASNAASGRSSAWPSICRASIFAAPCARTRATMPAEKSIAVTWAPVRAAASAAAPVPVATSITLDDGSIGSVATAASANNVVNGCDCAS